MRKLAIVAFILLAGLQPVRAQTVPPYPDTSATGTVEQMAHRLSVAQSQLDGVSATMSSDEAEIRRLKASLAATMAKGDDLKKHAQKAVDDFNLQVKGFTAACGQRMREESQEYEDCLHTQTDLKHRKDEVTHQVAEWQQQFDGLRKAFLADAMKLKALQSEVENLGAWKVRVEPAIGTLRTSIEAKCKPLNNCPAL